MRRWAVRILGVGGGVLFLALSILWFCVAREYRRDPIPLLDQPAASLTVRTLRESAFFTATGEPRRLLEYELDGAPEGPVRLALSLPTGPARHLPVVVILGGLEVGQESLRYVEAHGPNAMLALAYPRPTADLYEGRALFKLPRIRRAALAVPSQVCALATWARVQAWADPQRVSLLGYSFGAMFVPATARVAQVRGMPFRTLVMAYGGADLPGLLAANSDLRPAWVKSFAAHLVGSVIRPLEPALHLPHLKGETLFVTGLKDERVPLAYARLMQSLKPDPKTILDLDEGHMDPSLPDLNRKIVASSQAWLVDRGAMDAP
ncbi:MAG: prolyl oligopeptidase family serine peptidase [Holophagaceae bacterium]|nr:prolyl oligopeptidase family serine peptidase [Holophagaceae bacterium]